MKWLAHASFRVKLAVAFSSALLPVLLLMVWGGRIDIHHAEQERLDDQQMTADAVATQVEETFDAALALGWSVANDPIVQTLERERIANHLRHLVGRHPVFETIDVFDAQGFNRGRASLTESPLSHRARANRQFFRRVMGTNDSAISEVQELGEDGKQSGVIAGVPLRNSADQPVGMVTVAMTTERLSGRYREARLRPGQTVFLADRTGRLAFHSARPNLTYEQAAGFVNVPALRRALSGTPQAVPRFYSSIMADERIGAFVPTRKYHWAVGVTMPREIALADVHAMLRRQLFGFLGALLLSGFVATVLAKYLTSPLRDLQLNARAWGRGDFGPRVPVRTGDELGELGQTFNEMAHRIEERTAHLQESEERFRATFEQAAVGIAHVGLEGRWLWVNDRICEILGYSREELLQGTVQEITRPDDLVRCEAAARQFLEGGRQKYTVERQNHRKDGSLVWVNLTITLMRKFDNVPVYYVVVLEDISERKRMEAEREQLLQREQSARAAAEAASRTKDQFLAVVSHELRTPLTPVLAVLELLEKDPCLSAEAIAFLMMIRANIEMETRLINDLLDLSRMQHAKFDLKREIVDAHEVLDRVLNSFKNEVGAKRLHIQVCLRARDHLLMADPLRLQQVFWNLVSNAIKFTPEDGYIAIRSRNEEGALKVVVLDTGIGMTPEVQARLFNAFEQGEQTLSRRYGGLGLGLTISKVLVEMHGGRLAAASEGAGKGSTFSVTFPLLKTQPAKQDTPAIRQPEKPPAGAGYRILLVEDNPDTLGVLARLLERSGYRVRTATNVHDALEIAEGEHPELLVSDIGLPDATGWELLRELRKTRPIPAIAISGFGTPEDQQKSRETGFQRHLIKPINFQALREAILEISP